MPKNKESKSIKGVEHIQYVDKFDLLSSSIFGAAIGGIPRCCEKEGFNFIRASFGAIIISASTLLGTNLEALIGLSLYSTKGALVGLIAGTSMEASMGALGGFLMGISIEIRKEFYSNEFCSADLRNNALERVFYKTVAGAIAGFFISEMKQIQYYFALHNENVKHEYDNLSKNITSFNEVELAGNATYENS